MTFLTGCSLCFLFYSISKKSKGSVKTDESTDSEKITFDKLAQSYKTINMTEVQVTEPDTINNSLMGKSAYIFNDDETKSSKSGTEESSLIG